MLNPPLNDIGDPFRIENECFILQRKGIDFEVKVEGLGKMSGKGKVILNNFDSHSWCLPQTELFLLTQRIWQNLISKPLIFRLLIHLVRSSTNLFSELTIGQDLANHYLIHYQETLTLKFGLWKEAVVSSIIATDIHSNKLDKM